MCYLRRDFLKFFVFGDFLRNLYTFLVDKIKLSNPLVHIIVVLYRIAIIHHKKPNYDPKFLEL